MADAFGLLAEFRSPEDLVEAAKSARAAGYRDLDAFSPFPVYDLKSVLHLNDNRVQWLGVIGGITGAATALAMQLYTNYAYPMNVGGRPQYAVSAFAVVTFELTILFAALCAAIGMFALNGLPRLHHPVFEAHNFRRASSDRFFLCVLASDPKFEHSETCAFLNSLGASHVELVAP
jgi:hypothetical protein